MGAASDYLENKILDHILGKVTYTAPDTVYIGLAAEVNDDGSISGEPTEASYARVAVTNNATNFPAASNGSKSNGTDIVFGEATGDWGTVNYAFIADADTGGNVLLYGGLTTPKTINSGDIVKFLTGNLTFTMD
ncbi:MAG: hypothetical protein WDA59_06465 [Methanofastidiosum sp.]